MTKPLKTAILLVWIVLVFIPAAVGGPPVQPAGRIEGEVLDKRGYKMGGLTVTALGTARGNRYHATTDGEGGFVFDEVQPDHYTLYTDCPGIERVVESVVVEAGLDAWVLMLALAERDTGNTAVDKHLRSSALRGGPYPSGNISYLNLNDRVDHYFMFIYFGILVILSLYGVYRYRLVYQFLRYRRHKPKPRGHFAEEQLPVVTVQLPLFNEMYVAERLIGAVAKLDYPPDRFEIQVLDDSTDGTREIARSAVERHRAAGLDITYHHRTDRSGFKAGALEEGLKKAKGELILIFDADFLPRPNTIRRMVDYFTDERIGLVQVRWGHINADYSLLTRVQSIMLDGHLVIEQTARHRSGGFFNFNGTAGMWRRQAIEWSGGWQHDTLAEDTDLSYRAQLMGWRFVYLVDEDVPAELPVDITAFKSQQRRWAQGVVQVGIKLLKRMWHDPRLPLSVKLEQFFRLSGNLAAPLVIVLALVHLPILIVRYNQGFFHLFALDVPILTFSTLSVVAYYLVSQWHLNPKTWRRSIKYIPFVMSMGIALTFSNARAVLEALFLVKSPFIRTPKYGIQNSADTTWIKKSYVTRSLALPLLEILFALYFVFTIWYAIDTGIFGTIPFLLIYFFGYAYAAVMSLVQTRMNMRRSANSRK
jgi:cellulose synthase/poly-beta-1,6-N-acetylglucosamine synthase-like glycosyltransferase